MHAATSKREREKMREFGESESTEKTKIPLQRSINANRNSYETMFTTIGTFGLTTMLKLKTSIDLCRDTYTSGASICFSTDFQLKHFSLSLFLPLFLFIYFRLLLLQLLHFPHTHFCQLNLNDSPTRNSNWNHFFPFFLLFVDVHRYNCMASIRNYTIICRKRNTKVKALSVYRWWCK